MPKKSGKKYRKLSAQEKQKRKNASLLKNKINLVEFVSQHRIIKKEPPDDGKMHLETKINMESFDEEKHKRKDANLLKNKINLVEFVSQHRIIKTEPPDDGNKHLETNMESFDIKTETKQEQLSDYDYEYETSEGDSHEIDENAKRTLRSEFERARQRMYSKRWRQKPENQQKIKIYKKKIRDKLKEAKKIAKLEQAKYREATKHGKKIKITNKC